MDITNRMKVVALCLSDCYSDMGCFLGILLFSSFLFTFFINDTIENFQNIYFLLLMDVKLLKVVELVDNTIITV